ncbi:dipeptide epimerase [Myxococcus sp. CA051A]|uniref:Dipeptide epimerase n=1 Tax=Myxococcus llanfairpwllgwyngyllgogerychwyrndrobwllllantysiliogogogochensis TaxID=2590453 RepID=A0A540WZI7_9BACT|nr:MULTISPECIES: N-acetyl-D-Glu racemase DgcA [Myxococcus]NTX56098.1 dipeptide epimerase [Myxococcus sp. CA039A]NTX59783.1 dipeptide epimerase [Myxococcus sp. CA051A]TQF14428.1 dipeptide epimerase [Myxococcus llanfairpwllgwyngyllgogerychwyrndrobwllllantysiliogogogochensis]
MRKLTVKHESWPIAGSFTISRGSKTIAEVVVVTLEEGGAVGRGECVPYGRYGETVDGVLRALEAARPRIEGGLGRDEVPEALEPRAARNALDCALWDLEAKKTGKPIWELLGMSEPQPLVTAYTLSLDTAEAMGRAAEKSSHRPLLKVKLGRGSEGDIERLRAIRLGAPASRLIVDANEGWKPDELPSLLAACAELGVVMVEQPLPASDDEALRGLRRPVAVCADESAHDRHGLATLVGKYDALNIKLDKTGGLTEALALARDARGHGLQLMVGCMVATSLSMAPAALVAQGAEVVDLDGPLLLAKDREPGIHFEGNTLFWPPRELWG